MRRKVFVALVRQLAKRFPRAFDDLDAAVAVTRSYRKIEHDE